MKTLKWLHLSDWHQGNPENLDRRVVRNALTDSLRGRHTLNEDLRDLDFIFFTGDLAFSGKTSEYANAKSEFLDPILKVLEETGEAVKKDHILMVPGNHDVDRGLLENLANPLKTFTDRDAVNKKLENDSARRILLSPMDQYKKFCQEFGVEDSAFGYARPFEIRGTKVVVIGLNSAWMCGWNKAGETVNDYGFLILGEKQFSDKLPPDPRAQKAEIRICLLHHPFCWMSQIEPRDYTERRLIKHCHFILRGHEHDGDVTVPSSTAGECAVISCGSAYDRRAFPNGYNFVHLDLELRQGTVYLRKFDDKKNEFIPDLSLTDPKTPGIWTFTLPKELGRLPEPEQTRGRSAIAKAARPAKKMLDPAIAQALQPAKEKQFGAFDQSDLPEPEKELVERSSWDKIVGDIWAIQNPTMMTNLGEIYRIQHAGSRFNYINQVLLVEANCLALRGRPGYGEPDLIRTIKVFRPLQDQDPIYCYKMSLTFSPFEQFLGYASWTLTDHGNKSGIRTIPVPVRRVGRADIRELLLFFDPVLEPGTGPYTLVFEWRVNESMVPLRNEGRDELFFNATRAAGPIGRVDLVLKVPSSFGKVKMAGRPKASPEGRAMRADELSNYRSREFDVYGWTGEHLKGPVFAADVVKAGRDRRRPTPGVKRPRRPGS